MDFHWLNPQVKNRLVHTDYQALRKCCGCIHLRVGATFSCLLWAGLSLYFAILSFRNASPFYSYMSTPPLIVFGVVNLILTLVSLLGLLALFRNRWEYIRQFSHATWLAIFLVLVDGLINLILFITQQSQFEDWCVSSSANQLNSTVAATAAAAGGTPSSFDYQGGDYYNCNRLWQDEVKFGLISVFLMIVLYVYWAACIYSFSHKQGSANLAAQRVAELAAGGMMPPPPPPMHPQGPPIAGGPPAANRSNIIVLNNEKPSRSKKRKTTFSFRTLRPASSRGRRVDDVQRALGLTISADGRLIDLEAAAE